jgi:hypothetical protein
VKEPKGEVKMIGHAQDARTSKHLPHIGRRLGRTLQIAAAVPLVFALLAVLSPAAWAHEGNATITCGTVSYSYVYFPNQVGNTVHETVLIDGLKATSQNFTFNGPSGANVIDITVIGAASIEAKARWDTHGAVGHFAVTQFVSGCGPR